MPRESSTRTAAIPVAGGQHTNVPAYALKPDQAAQVINFMVTETGAGMSRPGTSLFVTPSASVATVEGDVRVIGLCAFLDFLVAVDANRRVYAIQEDGTQTDITGTNPLPGSAVPNFLDDNGTLLIFGGGAPLAWKGDASPCAFFQPDGGTPAPTHIVIMRRYLMANNDGSDRIDFSDPVTHKFDLSTNFFTAESKNDPVLALEVTFGEFYAMGSETIDIYYFTAADAAAPFSLNWVIQRGLGAVRASKNVDNTLYFLDTERKVCLLEERTPRAVSLQIEAQLKAMSTVADCVLHRIEFEGRHLLVWNFPTAQTTLVYDYVLSQWTEWREWSETDGWQPMSMLAYAFQPRWNKHFCSSFSTAEIYELSSSYQDDHGNPRRCERETAPNDWGTGLKKSSALLRFRCLRGSTTTADSDDAAYRPVLLVWWRDDNSSWRGPRRVNLGRLGDSNMYMGELRRNGMYRSRAYRFALTDPATFTLMSVEETFEVIQG